MSKAKSEEIQSLSVPASGCSKHIHVSKINDMYCEDEIACSPHRMVDHKNQCKRVTCIPGHVSNNTDAIPNFLEDIESTVKQLTSCLAKFREEQKQVGQNKEDVINNIKKIQTKLIDTINQHSEDAIQKVREEYDKLNQEFEEKVTDINSEIEKLDKLQAEVKSSVNDEQEAYVLSNEDKKLLSEAEELNIAMTQVKDGRRITFDIEDFYGKLLGGEVACLGTITVTPHTLQVICNIKVGEFGLHMWNLYDACCTKDGSIFFTCLGQNALLRVTDTTKTDVKKLELSSEPRGVCCVNDHEIAICLDKTIQMVDTKDKLVEGRSIHIGQQGYGLCFHDGIFYVLSKDNVYRYNKNGELLASVCIRNKLFSTGRNLVVNPVNNHIHIADNDKGVITLDQEGHVVTIDNSVPRPNGICVDQNGEVFVSGFYSDNIIQLTREGKYIQNLIWTVGMDTPKTICFDRVRGKLYLIHM
ncbi:hypothetical protein ACF0H5_019124 [Mactra antiquata]